MIGKYQVVLLAGLLPFAAAAQVVCALGPGVSTYKPGSDQRPTNDAMELAGRVNEAAKAICSPNCPTLALFRNATAANAMLIASHGQAKFVYEPQFFTTAYETYGDGAIIALIAHELGHALDDTLGARWIRKEWTPELRADSWAGCLVAKADLGPGDLEGAFAALAKYPPPSPPGWAERTAALRAGYTQCGGDGVKFDQARTIPH
jgi:hypothetical protein